MNETNQYPAMRELEVKFQIAVTRSESAIHEQKVALDNRGPRLGDLDKIDKLET
jgi:hypothetical protein